jgi:hypothetical protein
MSSNIWTRCGAKPNVQHHRGIAWRVVEDQHRISTRKLVESNEEHELLEALIDGAKPRLPEGIPSGLDYLLFTPFRYPPLRHGSRFGTRAERGIWYGSEQIRTALSEVGYYRLLLLDGTDAARSLTPLYLTFTIFSVQLKSDHAVDLTMRPFDTYQALISSKTDYAASQRLGSDMREAGVDLFRYVSARDTIAGINVGIFSPTAFAAKKPARRQSWFGVASLDAVEFTRKDGAKRASHRMVRTEYEVDGRLPAPAF